MEVTPETKRLLGRFIGQPVFVTYFTTMGRAIEKGRHLLKEVTEKTNPDGRLLLSLTTTGPSYSNICEVETITNPTAIICKLPDACQGELVRVLLRPDVYNAEDTSLS